ncbi:MAG: tagaturonate reductase [Bacteroidota bacterium]
MLTIQKEILPLNRTTAKVPQQLSAKILQFGGGNFLRAFVDFLIDQLNELTDFEGGIICVKPTPSGDYQALRTQDGLFHVLTRGINQGVVVEETHLVKSVQQVVHPYRMWSDYLATAHEPDLQFVVSNTTEAGIVFDKEPLMPNQSPIAFPAKLTAWLLERWTYFDGDIDKGCIFLPCELIAENGQQLKHCILQYAEYWRLPAAFVDWLVAHNTFCNTLVDRIVPGFPTTSQADIFQKIGYTDELLVTAEPYLLWAIEMPENVDLQALLPFHETPFNVVFTKDLQPFREQKVRILNGAHIAMVPVGYLRGIATVGEVMQDDYTSRFVETLIREEVIPTLDYPTEQLEQYTQATLDRFRNPFIQHFLLDISLNAIPKFKTRLLPSLLVYQNQKQQLPTRIVESWAALIVFYRGMRGSESIPLKATPAIKDFFQQAWTDWAANRDTNKLVKLVLSTTDFWQQDLSDNVALQADLVAAVEAINAA